MHVVRQLRGVGGNSGRAPQATNALVFSRIIILHLTEHLGAEELQQCADVPVGFMQDAANGRLTAGENAAVAII